MERFGGCWGRAFWLLYIDLGDQRSDVGMLFSDSWESFGGLWRNLGVLWVSLGRSMDILGALGMSWERPGGPLG